MGKKKDRNLPQVSSTSDKETNELIISTNPRMHSRTGFFEQVPWSACSKGEARKIYQGILITSFEMPFNAWSGGCNSMIVKGDRFNAE
ncbi:coiled-coil domain-containing protein 130 homolog isoform X1 [Manihot esculenta]|uniref:Uncharacterized protein n=1 Tax=Manihot esculenta TaxID=3983 RepID=A0A2C9VQ26_MANES|nr:coiled-coil domain-containing protein 130 homolog isoform X1 [Manihot esculenta]